MTYNNFPQSRIAVDALTVINMSVKAFATDLLIDGLAWGVINGLVEDMVSFCVDIFAAV